MAEGADNIISIEDEIMRRKGQRKTHLDLPSPHDDGTAKIHKRKGTSQSNIAVTILCGLVALGTLFYVSNKVFNGDGGKMVVDTGKEAVSGSGSLPHKERFMGQQNRLLPPDSIYRTKVRDIHNDWQELMKYSGSVNLVVNVACE